MPTTTPDVLHVTNGDLAAARIEAAVGGPVLPWRDVLHEGPVPAGLGLEALSAVRARFIAGAGWGEHGPVAAAFRARDQTLRAARGEVVLWFEHDLYDQLQLVQLLAELAGIRPRRLTIVQTDDFLSNLDADRLRAEHDARLEVDDGQIEAAALA